MLQVTPIVFVVDDDVCVRESLELLTRGFFENIPNLTFVKLIESFGFPAEAFESTEYFLRSGHLHDTSCLVLDVQMPGMNGLQLQSRLAAAGCGIPIIFISAYESKDSRQRAMQAGAAAFLGKPFSDEQLLQIIRSALRFFQRNDC